MSAVPGPFSEPPKPRFRVTDLKQYAYCPRVVFYTYCLPLLRPTTYKMEESHLAHAEEAIREERRSLRAYGLPEGERAFDVPLSSARLGLRGQADMVINTGAELIPVDYKLTEYKGAKHFHLQLAAYGLMLAESSALPSRRGFLYSVTLRRAEEVVFTKRLCNQVQQIASALYQMVEREQMPPVLARRGRCVACEFRRFCNES
jgi:CRISPR-associated exonuclease Cas4